MKSLIELEFLNHLEVGKKSLDQLSNSIEKAAQICIDSLKQGNKLILFGNGGSASDAQHIAAEIVGRYKTNRIGLPAIAINTDTSIITAVSNDFGYSQVFKRQIQALANNGDTLIGISTGGTSNNVVEALKISRDIRCPTIGLSGKGGGDFSDLCDVNIIVPSSDTARIQEIHILIGHILCHLIDQAFLEV